MKSTGSSCLSPPAKGTSDHQIWTWSDGVDKGDLVEHIYVCKYTCFMVSTYSRYGTLARKKKEGTVDCESDLTDSEEEVEASSISAVKRGKGRAKVPAKLEESTEIEGKRAKWFPGAGIQTNRRSAVAMLVIACRQPRSRRKPSRLDPSLDNVTDTIRDSSLS